MSLDILIIQYYETEEVLKNMLDSIASQQNVDWNNIHVIIGNDGSDINISQNFLLQYDYDIQYIKFDHGGVSKIRKNLYHCSHSDYLMFCDADDTFNMNTALSIIMTAIEQEQPKIIVPTFLEELYDKNRNKHFYIPHVKDSVFVHGKVYQRKFLKTWKIEWHPEVGANQDSCFNVLALTAAGKEVAYCNFPLYTWKNNPNSVSRREEAHTVKSWCDMINSYRYCIRDLLDRGFGDQGRMYSFWCLYATYQEMFKPQWEDPQYINYKILTYKHLKDFYYDHILLIQHISDKQKEQIIKLNEKIFRDKGCGKLLEQEHIPFEEWLAKVIE